MATAISVHPRKAFEVRTDRGETHRWLAIDTGDLEIIIHENETIGLAAIIAAFKGVVENEEAEI